MTDSLPETPVWSMRGNRDGSVTFTDAAGEQQTWRGSTPIWITVRPGHPDHGVLVERIGMLSQPKAWAPTADALPDEALS